MRLKYKFIIINNKKYFINESKYLNEMKEVPTKIYSTAIKKIGAKDCMIINNIKTHQN